MAARKDGSGYFLLQSTMKEWGGGYMVVHLVEAPRYKPEVHGFNSWWGHRNFSLT